VAFFAKHERHCDGSEQIRQLGGGTMNGNPIAGEPDVILIGAGIMSATFGTFLKVLEPSLNVAMFETLHDCAQESSDGWNNAGTGHAANCELNYTPQRDDGSIDISRALEVNTEFDLSRQLWSFLVNRGAIPDPRVFIHPCPHMSFVWGAGNVAFLRQRFKEMSAHHCFHGMEYSEDRGTIADWAPLVIDGRNGSEPFAATRIITGSDVDYGALTHLLVKHLTEQAGFAVHYNRKVVGLDREHDGRWRVSVVDTNNGGGLATASANFVFIGAGGGALPLLQKSTIPEGKGYGGFPVSGIWLRCDVDSVSQRHHAKVYGKAAVGSPPMSVPHLDTRIIGGKHSLLFGPYAGFSTRFLKHGELTDLFTSLSFENVIPLLDVARDNFRLAEYLIGQVLETSNQQFTTLKQFFPRAVKKDWKEAVAGQRVETIKPLESKGLLKHEEGELEFGTELVVAEDKSIVALLGASPGASTAAFIAIEVIEKCFNEELTANHWLPRLKAIIPSYGESLIDDAALTQRIRADTAAALRLNSI
jgi:malate dehydrogenase (quinone)